MLRPIDEPPQRLSRAEYRAWAAAQPHGRFERHSGVVVAMAPERAVHALLKANAWLLLRQSVQAHRLPCQVFPDGMTVEIDEDDDFEPDAIVRCGDRLADDLTTVPDPLIVVEVLSPSTSATDRTTKLEKYFRLPTVQHYSDYLGPTAAGWCTIAGPEAASRPRRTPMAQSRSTRPACCST